MGKQPIMLIVDDIEMNRSVLKEIFNQNFTICEAENGDEALRVLRGYQKIDIVLLDIIMPVKDGFDVLKEMREDPYLKEVSVVVNTQYGEDENEIKALELGAADFIVKPYNPEVVKRRIQNVLMKEKVQFLEGKTKRDTLTGIYNREAFTYKTVEMLHANKDTQYVLISWDIERFKVINELYGRQMGDSILQEMAASFDATMKPYGTYGRLEGDNFAICFPEKLLDVFTPEKIIENTKIYFKGLDLCYDVAVYIGIYVIENIDLPVDQMCDRANLALRTVKGNYMKRYAYYDDKLRNTIIEEQEIITEMDAALENGQFCIYLQPIYSISSGRPVSAEALVRWKHPSKGIISPGVFIPLFERNGFIGKLDNFVLEQACRYIAEMKDMRGTIIPISVNISRNTIYNMRVTEMIREMTDRYGLETSDIRLEITESAYTDNPHQLLSVMKALQKQGYKVLMDDFGSGYSSLNMIKDVPVDILKIDMDFVNDLETSDRAGSVLNSVVRMAKWLEMPVIAEGVETQAQLDFLRSIGCDWIQGYFYSKPLPLGDFTALMTSVKSVERMGNLPEINIKKIDDYFDLSNEANQMLEQMYGGMAIYELYGDTMEVVRVNQGYFDLTGSTSQTLYRDTKDAFSWVHEEDKKKLLTVCRKAEKQKTLEQVTVRRYHQQGFIMWLNLWVRCIGRRGGSTMFSISFNDVTEQKKLEQQKYVYQYGEALAESYDDIIEINFTKGYYTCLRHDENLIHHVGIRRGLTKEIDMKSGTVHPEDLKKLRQLYSESYLEKKFCIENKSVVFENARIMKKDGKYHKTQFTILRLDNAFGDNCCLSCMRDLEIKEEKKAGSQSIHAAKETALPVKTVEKALKKSVMTSSEKRQILVVDDNQINRMMLRKMLSEKYDILEAENGQKALQILQTEQNPVSVVLLDIVMPVMDGYGFLKERKKDPQIATLPVLVLSNAENNQSELKALSLGASDFLKKPYEPAVIHKRMENLIQLSESMRDSRSIHSVLDNLPGVIAIYEFGDREERIKIRYLSQGFFANERSINKNASRKDFNKNPLAIVYPEDMLMLEDLAEEVLKTHESIEVQFRYYRNDGTLAWGKALGKFAFTDGDMAIYYAVMTDITQQKQAEELLTQQHHKLKAQQHELETAYTRMKVALEQSEMETWEYDIPNRMMKIPKRLAQKLGWPSEIEDISKQLDESTLIPPVALSVLKGVFWQLEQGESPVEGEYPIILSDGQEIWQRVQYVTVFDSENQPVTAVGISQDITKEVQAKRQYEHEASYRRALTRDALMFMEYDMVTGKPQFCDTRTYRPEFKKVRELDMKEAYQFIRSHLLYSGDCSIADDFLTYDYLEKEMQKGRHEFMVEARMLSPTGTYSGYHWVEVSFSLVVNPATEHLHIFVCIEDIDEDRRKAIAVMEKAQRDPLTGLFNRVVFEELASNALRQSSTNGGISAFLLLDIDDFKQVNDFGGHRSGDIALQHVATILKENCRKNDLQARMGGDEMAVLLSNIPSIEYAVEKGKTICDQVREWKSGIPGIELTCSIGVAAAPANGDTFDVLYHNADIAMYQGKKAGKNGCHLYSSTEEIPKASELSNREWLVDALDECIYIADVENYNLIFLNYYGRKMVKAPEGYIGEKCYKILENRDTPCPFCKNAHLIYDDFYRWIKKDPVTGQELQIKDKLIDWRGRPARMGIQCITKCED